MLVDLHSHTIFSDGRSTHAEMVEAAIAKGIGIYGIADHLCFHDNPWTTRLDQFEEMRSTFANLKANTTSAKILFGMEVDYVRGCENRVLRLKEENHWDYIIGSVHYIGDWNIDSNAADWEGKDVDATYTKYLELLEEMVDTKLYNIVAHLDLPKKYGHFTDIDFTDRYRAIGEKILANNMAFEMNTAGRIKICNEFYPRRDIVELYHQLGVDVTLGSDAHHRNNVGQFFDEAVALLKEVGYSRICYFEEGQKRYLPL
ncbi:histidinol-phosphatase [uncultured Acetobacteroides sp.]|uniref:histidinol-phosphatase n=1 Tax=uncultured Acetobacteroides sp. TaxID=1760811 RepID=UPI0029F5C8C6|nr:histidinol-phosphatase [uncultured Acetobacteroides sp.]